MHVASAPVPLPKPSLAAFLGLGFRPLYLAGAAWASISVAIWVFFPQVLSGPLPGVLWHAHEMLWGFVATIAVGFLMTAGANWTGLHPLGPRALAAVCLLWLVARAGFLVHDASAFRLAATADVAFFLVPAAAMTRVLVLSRNARNYGVPGLLVALAFFDAVYLRTVAGGDYLEIMRHFRGGLLVMAALTLLVAGRVIPFFAMRAIPGLEIPMQTRLGQVRLGACLAAAALWFVELPLAASVALALAGTLALVQLVRWKPAATRGRPLLWILYVGYAGLAAGLVAAACEMSGLHAIRVAAPVHAIAMGGFSVLIIGMMTRTALGHLGRPLQADRSMVTSYVLVIVAAVLRLAALVPSPMAAWSLRLSAALWIAAFSLYLWRFTPLMIRPRS